MGEDGKLFFMCIGWLIAVGATGAAFTAGVALVGRWLKWAPININVTVNGDATAHQGENSQ